MHLSYIGQNISTSKTKKSRPNLFPNSIPQFSPNLPEYCPNIFQILPELDTLVFGGGGGGVV